jgi:hypothetical protein
VGSKSSTSASTNQTQQYDQRSITTVDDRDTSYAYDLSNRSTNVSDHSYRDNSTRTNLTDNSYRDNSSRVSVSDDRDTYSYDSSVRDNSTRLNISDDRDWYAYDSSDRSVSNSDDRSWFYSDASNHSVTNVTGADPGAVRLGELNSQLLGAVAETQTDAVKSLAGFGYAGLRDMGESVTNLYSVAGSNASKAWAHTVDASEATIAKLLDGASKNSDSARAIAMSAMSNYQPAENKAQDTALKLGMIAAAGVAAVMFLRKG